MKLIINIKKMILLMAFLFCAIILLSSCSIKKINLPEKYTISDLDCAGLYLSSDDKKCLNEYISNWYYEDTTVCGFVSNNNVDFYVAYNVVRTLKLLKDSETLSSIKNDLKFMETVNVKGYDILNILYYKYICDAFDFTYNKSVIKEVLYNYFDPNYNLFFLSSINDNLPLKHVVSALVIDICKDLIEEKIDLMVESAKEMLDSTTFEKDLSKTLYSTGGSILYYCDKLDMDLSDIVSQHEDWIEFWGDFYEKSFKNAIEYIIVYSEYLEIALIFDENYSRDKIDNFYNNITYNSIERLDDIQYVYNSVINCSNLNNIEVNKYILAKTKTIIDNSLFNKEINARATAFGIAISNFTGFEYNKEKINNFLKNKYNNLLENDDKYYIAENLYYLIGIDQLVNGLSKHTYEQFDIQNIINVLLNSFKYGSDANYQDIMAERYVVELISALEIFSNEGFITEKQYNNLKKTVEEGLNNVEILNSVYFVFLKNIDYRMGLNLIDDQKTLECINKLNISTGFKSSTNQNNADLYSTFQFVKCIEASNLNEAKSLIEDIYVDIDYENMKYSFLNQIEPFNVMAIYMAHYINNVKNNLYANEK